ncbi:MAG: hypothetical protein IJ934_02515 [Acetobacter sp.]|nr:hypothetical protein [Acetobacter sp.]
MMQNSVDAAAEAISSTQGASCGNIPWNAVQAAQLFVAVNFERQSRWVTGYDATGYFSVKATQTIFPLVRGVTAIIVY